MIEQDEQQEESPAVFVHAVAASAGAAVQSAATGPQEDGE